MLSFDVGKELIEVISSRDDAVTCSPDGYKTYLDTLDEAALCLKPGNEPTRFVLRRVLPYGAAKNIKTEQAGVNRDGKMEVRMGYTLEEIRACLVDIKNPGIPQLTFKKDDDGYASKEIISLLESTGILNELVAARHGATQTGGAAVKKS